MSTAILHTGQHYDHGMSGVFFEELEIPQPRWNLCCGGGTHGSMTGAMLAGIEEVLMEQKPVMSVVFGDTNSTLAGALASAKLNIPVAHVEAGLRSGNRRMPEELNRICTDHLSDLLFCTSEGGRAQLADEGISRGVHVTGDVMADVFHSIRQRNMPLPDGGGFALLTLHRAENTDSPEKLRSIFAAIEQSGIRVVFPIHPRTAKMMADANFVLPANLDSREPCSYSEMVSLICACDFVMTDSGGLQKEAYWAGKPCITLRSETEWAELVDAGWNVVTGAETSAILHSMQSPPRGKALPRPQLYGDDGKAAVRVAGVIREFLSVST